MVPNRPLIAKSFSPYTNSMVTVPSTPITIGIPTTLTFISFFQFSCKGKVFIFQFYPEVS